MLETAIHEEAEAALNRLLVKHQDLKQKLKKAYGLQYFLQLDGQVLSLEVLTEKEKFTKKESR